MAETRTPCQQEPAASPVPTLLDCRRVFGIHCHCPVDRCAKECVQKGASDD